VTPEALDYLTEVGWDPDFGARPLKRAIQREVKDLLALKVLSGEVHPGETIHVARGAQGLVFETALVGEPANT
jgi:ATP-dependent Clp protease ATP-binding subunit ClpB